ncbi:hypothetical protein SDC9_170232 [bioreactor metagenome]|uniref:Uncharacterized protein n=1 Tax=bioreactor metagenome TaxID=1076179 RepID=A0A645G7H1_9ZZZZ
MGKQVEVLEHHAKVQPRLRQLLILQILCNAGYFFGDRVPVQNDRTFFRALQAVDAPKKGAFARAGRTNDGKCFALFQGQVDIFQYFGFSEVFI